MPPEMRHSLAAERNRAPILAQLQRWLPAQGRALEIAAWRDSAALPRLLPPVALDVLAPQWPVAGEFDAVFCANLLHISPWPACAALMRGAARHLAAQGQLIVYGPFIVDGVVTAPSNLAFDADLRARDPAWGLRLLAGVADQAQAAGLEFVERAAMPVNNLMLRFTRAASPFGRAPARR